MKGVRAPGIARQTFCKKHSIVEVVVYKIFIVSQFIKGYVVNVLFLTERGS